MLQSSGECIEVHVMIILVEEKGKKYVVDAGDVTANKLVFMLRYAGASDMSNHYDMLQRKVVGGYSVIFDKRKPESLAAAWQLIEEIRNSSKAARAAMAPRSRAAAPTAVAVVTAAGSGGDGKTAVSLQGFDGKATDVAKRLAEAGYNMAGAQVGELGKSGKSREIVFGSNAQAARFRTQILARRPNASVSVSAVRVKSVKKPQATEAAQLAEGMTKVLHALQELTVAIKSGRGGRGDGGRGTSPQARKANFDAAVETKKQQSKKGICRAAEAGEECRFWPNCRFSHPGADRAPQGAAPCRKFQKAGACDYGGNCKFSHEAQPNPAPQPAKRTPKFIQQGATLVENPAHKKQVCRDHARGVCKRVNCKFLHPAPKQEICRDHARGKCMWVNCKFLHA